MRKFLNVFRDGIYYLFFLFVFFEMKSYCEFRVYFVVKINEDIRIDVRI